MVSPIVVNATTSSKHDKAYHVLLLLLRKKWVTVTMMGVMVLFLLFRVDLSPLSSGPLMLVVWDNSTATNMATTIPTDEKKTDSSIKEKKNTPPLWSRARSDRSGAVIQDMLMAHAYAYHNEVQYGGACVQMPPGVNNPKEWYRQRQEANRIHNQLLQSVGGLSHFLHLRDSCPPDTSLMNRESYIQNDTAIFTPDYLTHVRSLLDDTIPQSNNKHRTIVVHIRRGDITPCRPRTRGYPRYLPNQHYLRLIERYKKENDNVVIYSESGAFESFQPFVEKGYQLVLDGDIATVWKGILASEVVILSRSSFSLIPAILSKAMVVYTPFWHDPLSHWQVVDDAFLNETQTEFRRLKQERCPNKKKNKKQ